jgi:ribosomal protein S18 acetylase RimI-like enzyme
MQEDRPRSGPSLLVRHAVPDDTTSLAELIVQLAAHHGDQATTDGASLRVDLFSSSPWAIALVAELGGNLLGYALLVRLYRAQFATRMMDLHHLFVVPAARGTGAGTALIRAARVEAEAQGCAQLVVGVHPDNIRAQGFYRKLGFQDAPPGGPRFRLELEAGR